MDLLSVDGCWAQRELLKTAFDEVSPLKTFQVLARPTGSCVVQPQGPGDPPGTPCHVLLGSTCEGHLPSPMSPCSVPPSRPHARSRPGLCSSPTSLLGLAQPASPHKKVTCRVVSPPCRLWTPLKPLQPRAHRGRRLSRQAPGTELALSPVGPSESWRRQRESPGVQVAVSGAVPTWQRV